MVAKNDSWEAVRDELHSRYPKATDGILFCVHKLSQDAQLTIPDFRDEAALHGIKLGGRALHSAKVCLGLVKAAERKRAERPAKAGPTEAPNGGNGSAAALEASLIGAIQQIQDQATAESRRLREAMQAAVDILSDALRS